MTGELTPLEKSLMGQVARLESELAALREKYRWRKQSEEPMGNTIKRFDFVEVIPDDRDHTHRPLIMRKQSDVNLSIPWMCFNIEQVIYWRPLDLPEDAHHA